MFERFSEEARRATALAAQDARQLGHDFIGTEHLLMGLLGSEEGPAYLVLTELEVTLEDVRRKVTERVHPYGSDSVESPPFTPLAKKSLERALREALQLNSGVIGSEHLLLGLIAVPDGGGARILAELAGSLDQVREVVLGRVGRPPTPGAPLEQTKAPVTGKTLRRWAAQGRTAFRPPASSPETAAGRFEGSGAVGPPPRCPACQSSLVTDARYRQVSVAPGTDTDDGPPDAPETGAPVELDAPPETAAGEFSPPAAGITGEPDPAEAVTVTFVYCGQCGVALGIA